MLRKSLFVLSRFLANRECGTVNFFKAILTATNHPVIICLIKVDESHGILVVVVTLNCFNNDHYHNQFIDRPRTGSLDRVRSKISLFLRIRCRNVS